MRRRPRVRKINYNPSTKTLKTWCERCNEKPVKFAIERRQGDDDAEDLWICEDCAAKSKTVMLALLTGEVGELNLDDEFLK